MRIRPALAMLMVLSCSDAERGAPTTTTTVSPSTGASSSTGASPVEAEPHHPTAVAPAEPVGEARRAVDLGLLDREGLLAQRLAQAAQEWVEEPEPHLVERELSPDERARIVAELDAALAAHASEQAQWTDPTDPARLRRAFDALSRDGILARQAYGMYEPDALSLLQVEADAAPTAPRGYVFYDRQMLEETLNGRLRLAWGSFAGGEVDTGTPALGQAIVRALRDQGLSVAWDGSTDAYIQIEPLLWRVRRDPQTGAPLADLGEDEARALELEP